MHSYHTTSLQQKETLQQRIVAEVRLTFIPKEPATETVARMIISGDAFGWAAI